MTPGKSRSDEMAKGVGMADGQPHAMSAGAGTNKAGEPDVDAGLAWWRANRARKSYFWLRIVEAVIFEIYGVRKWIAAHPWQTGAASLGLIMLCLIANLVLLTKPAVEAAAFEQVQRHWYYDLNTGELFVAAAGQTAPIDAPSGPYQIKGESTGHPAGVRAFVFSCTDCSVESRRFVGYLEVYHPHAKQRIDDLHEGKRIEVGSTLEAISRATGPPLIADALLLNWVPMGSDKSSEIIMRLAGACPDGSPPTPCLPPPVVLITDRVVETE